MRVFRVLSFLVLLVLAASSLAAERLSNGYTQHPDAFFRSGFWWDPSDPGWGIDLHMSGDAMVGTWATYNRHGNPVWYLGVGELRDGVWVMPLESYARSASGEVSGTPAGELVLDFNGGYEATMDWRLGGRSGRYEIEPYIISGVPIAEDHTGFWFEPAHPGYGMSITTQREYVMSVFLFYNNSGSPRWVWADNIGAEDREVLQALSFTGACPGCEPVAPSASDAGQFRVSFRSENHATLDADLRVRSRETYAWQVEDATINLLSERASGRDQPFRLMPFTNASTLEAYLEAGMVDPGPYEYPLLFDDPVFSPAPVTGAEAVSTTNLQEQGVDESDVVKTDGRFIYALDDHCCSSGPRRIRVLEMTDEPPLEQIGVIELPEEVRLVDGFYLHRDRDEGLPDLLVVTEGTMPYYLFDVWFAPYQWTDATTRLLVYDVTDPAAAQLLSTVEMEGGLVESRRIGETLYLVTRFQPDASPVHGAGSPAELVDVLDALTLQDLLPELRINGESGALVDPATTLLPPQPPGYRYIDLVTISAFDLARPGSAPATVTFSGFAEAVYVSRNNVFIASSRFASSIDPGFNVLEHSEEVFTDVHQFGLSGAGPVYLGSGVVEGFVSWGGTSPSFSFSEYDGHLRVVSTSGHWQGSEHRVSVLALADESRDVLPLRGVAPDPDGMDRLGKPGEMLYGVRFLDDRLYAVTFKNIDPLYVVDLANPWNPEILGEVEVTGFSDYLHPLPNNLLLGFGKEAIPADSNGDGNFAWYQGLQVSLFDVSRPQDPRLIQRIELGRRGSASPLLADHHAFSYLPPDAASGRPARVGIPVVIHDAKRPSDVSSDPQTFYEWQATGLAMFDLPGVEGGAADLVLRDVLVTHAAGEDPEHDSYRDAEGTAGRGIITDENAYFYLRGDLYSAPWGNGDAMDGPF